MNFTAFPLTGSNLPPQSVTLFANDRRCGKVVLEPRERIYSIDLPSSCLRKGRNDFRFEYGFSAVPAQLGMGPDVRQLAVLFKTIHVVPGTNDQTPVN